MIEREPAGHEERRRKTEKEAKVLFVKRMCMEAKKEEDYIKKLDCSR